MQALDGDFFTYVSLKDFFDSISVKNRIVEAVVFKRYLVNTGDVMI